MDHNIDVRYVSNISLPPKLARKCEIENWLPFGADGRFLGREGGRCEVTWLPNFLGWVVYFIFLPMLLRSANVKSFIILRLGERVTSFTKDSNANLCSEK